MFCARSIRSAEFYTGEKKERREKEQAREGKSWS